jgi:hypothetical protein
MCHGHGERDEFDFYIHDGAGSFPIEIEGNLVGNAAGQVDQAWRTASSTIGNRALVVSIGTLRAIDPFGCMLLQRLHEAGARFVAKAPLTGTLIRSIVGQPVGAAMGVARSGSWARVPASMLPMISIVALCFPAVLEAANLEPATSKAWDEYVESANRRMTERLSPGKTFLWVDEKSERIAKVRTGEVAVSPVGSQNPRRVPAGLIHDWIGAVFIAHAQLADVLDVVSDYDRYKDFYRPPVVESKVIAIGDARDRFSLLLVNRSLLLKTAFDTDYESCYVRLDNRHGYSISRTTRIQEIEEYGSSAQHMLHEGEGSGIIWQLFGIARYMERDGGVYIELEAIGLSRDIPGSLRWLVEPIVRRVSRGSLATSLRQTKSAVQLHAELADRKTDSEGLIAATVRGGPPQHDSRAVRASR